MTDVADLLQQTSGSPRDGAAGETLTITSDDLERLWLDLMPDSYPARRGLDAFTDAVQAGAGQAANADLEFRPGGWQVNMRHGAVQTIVASALIAGLLAAFGATQIPAALVTAVVPLFFDIQRVTLTPGQEYLLAELVAYKEALDGTLSPRELYARLSEDDRSHLSFMDFTDFLDTCRRAGLADTTRGGTVIIRPADQARFRITMV